ncbi:MAG TPA: DUF5591 domain-containing protein, partial [Thermoplasmata archaeon]|nr:DUF5591 domain-containing protein [Thermoplasmata archaeon]
MVVESTAPPGPGTRAVALLQGDSRLQLDFPVLAPEISGTPGGTVDLGSGCWYLHWPIPQADWELVAAGAPELVVLGNARVLFGEGEPFVRAIQEIRERLGGRPVLWAPRVALPHRLAYLVYVGVDLLDATESLWQNRTGVNLDATMGASPATISPVDEVASSLAEELARVRAAAIGGRLRELVEIRISAEPALAEHLRYADRHLATLLEERTPVVGDGQHRYVLRESRRRPEVQRFVRRIIERYRPPISKKVLLILPCSKTKPYRASPSHRSYRRALEGLQPIERVHTMSVTSPLGLVPRELEDVPPARHYDIPVTGEWDEEERSTVVAAVRHVLSSGAYESVVVHLDPIEYAFLRDVSNSHPHSVWSAMDDRTLSPPALASLRQAIGDALESCPPAPGGPLAVVREELREIAAVQFGRAAADRLFAPPVRLAGRPWFQRVVDGGGVDLATWRDERGLFQLTVAGARRVA